MKKLRMVWTILACLLILPAFLEAEVVPPAEGDKLSDIRLAIPADAGYRTYLGIKGEGTFSLPQIKASVVIVEISVCTARTARGKPPASMTCIQKFRAAKN